MLLGSCRHLVVAALIASVCIGCAPSDAEVVESARDECEAREGHTELRRNGPLYHCYEVTVEEDGWRLCYLSEPVILVRAVGDDEPDEGSRWGCGNTGSRYGDERQEPVSFPAVGTAPEGCKSAVAWFKDYLASVERALVEEQSNLASAPAGATQVAVAYERFGRLLEQATPRADAVRDACHEDPDPDLGLGVSIGMYEIEDELHEMHRGLLKACIEHGGVDCGVLAPTAKESCEAHGVAEFGEEWVYRLDEETVEFWGLDGFPYSSPAIGCQMLRPGAVPTDWDSRVPRSQPADTD